MTVADDLRAGATYIREHGHTQKVAEDSDGSVCALGGIARGVGANPVICYGETFMIPFALYCRFDTAAIALSNYLHAMNVSPHDVATWNYRTSADDVITHMEKAAAWIEEQV